MVNASRRMDGQQAHCNTFPDSYNHGCGAHPDLEEHAQIAAALETSLRNYRLAVI